MKPWIKRSLIGLFGAGIVLGGLSACGDRHERFQIGGEYESKFAEKMVDRVTEELALNDMQRQKLVLLGDRIRNQRKVLVSTTTDPRAEMQALVSGAEFDRSRAQAIVDEKSNAIRGTSPEVIAAAADFFDGLNAEQQQKLRDHLQKRHRWFGHG